MPSNNSPVRTCCSRTTAFSSENRPCPHHSDPPTLSFRPAHTVIPTRPHCHSDRREESKVHALKQLASPYLLFTDHRLFHLQRCRQRPAWTIAMKIEARSTNPSFPRRACPRAPTRGRESRGEGKGPPIFIPLCGLRKAIVIPSAAESRNLKCPSTRILPLILVREGIVSSRPSPTTL